MVNEERSVHDNDSYVKIRLSVDIQIGDEQHIVHEADFVFANRSLVDIQIAKWGTYRS